MINHERLDIETKKSFDMLIENLLLDDNNSFILVDPLEQKRIGAHYGETHLCAALLLRAKRDHNNNLLEIFNKLLNGILDHWTDDKKLKNYHADFNNFALSIIYNNVDSLETKNRIMQTLIGSDDSRNLTINWLPMKVYTNLTRYAYSKEKKYFDLAVNCYNKILSAYYQDGMIDDLLPKGESFNIQYCISTAATIALINKDYPAFADRLQDIPINKTITKLLNCVLPDGDINYMGRGCNQLFGWGPWLFLTSGINDYYINISRQYFEDRYPTTVTNMNLFLNPYKGLYRDLWWDYHYYSVYASHFLMWYELTNKDDDSYRNIPEQQAKNDSGFDLIRTSEYAIAHFSGRKHYLIEQGPSIVALWTKKRGSIYKCGHGPTRDNFGSLYFNPISVCYNHFGLIEITDKGRLDSYKIVRRIKRKFGIHEEYYQSVKPVYTNTSTNIHERGIVEITFSGTEKKECAFLLPVFNVDAISDFKLIVDGKEIDFRHLCNTRSQYGECFVFSSAFIKGKTWVLQLEL